MDPRKTALNVASPTQQFPPPQEPQPKQLHPHQQQQPQHSVHSMLQPKSKREEIHAQVVQRYRLPARKHHENILMKPFSQQHQPQHRPQSQQQPRMQSLLMPMMEVTSAVKFEVVPIPARNLENLALSQKHQDFKDSAPSSVGENMCSPESCRCPLCTSQCSAKGGNLSLDGSTLSSCCCNSANTSASSYQDSADSDLSCLSDGKKSLEVNMEGFSKEDTGRNSGETKKVYPNPSPKGLTQTADEPDTRETLDQECKNGNRSGESDLKLQSVQDNVEVQALDTKIVRPLSLSEAGEHGELSHCQLNQPDNHNNPYSQEFPTKENCDVRSDWPVNKQVAEVRPLKATLGVETIHSLKKPRKATDSSFHMSCTRDVHSNGNGGQTEQTEEQQTTHIEKAPGSMNTSSAKNKLVSVGYGSNTLGAETIHSLKKPRKATDSSLYMSCTRDNASQTEQIEEQQTTHVEKAPGSMNRSSATYKLASVGYGSNNMVRSNSYSGDVQEIVDNVLRANLELPVILQSGASQVNAAPRVVLSHPSNRTSQMTTPPDSDMSANNLDKVTDKPSAQSDPPVSPKPKTSLITEPQEQANSTRELYKKDCPDQAVMSDQNLISLVTYMVRKLPYCINGDQKFVLATDVEEIVFANHKGMTGTRLGEDLSNSEMSDIIDFCTVDSQNYFATQCQSVKPGDILVPLQWLSTKSFLEMVREKTTTARQRSPVSKHSKTLLGEVHFENHSFAILYHFDKSSRRLMTYAPACDLMAAFPESASVLKMLAPYTWPGSGACIAYNMRFRRAEPAEAQALMRYKGASGRLAPKDWGWCYLTSRSILVHWQDFRHTFLLGSSLRVSYPSLRDEQQAVTHHASPKTVSPHQGIQYTASIPTIKVTSHRKSKLEKSGHSPPTGTRGIKRKRSFTKLVRMKKGTHKRVKAKTRSPTMCRTSTPVTTITYSAWSKDTVRTDDEEKTSGLVPFSRRDFTASPVGKESPLSSSMNNAEERMCKGMWKLQQELLKSQEEKKKTVKKRNYKRKDNKTTVKIKNGNDELKDNNSSSVEEQKLKEQFENLVNSNPFTQSIESLKMVKQMNKVMDPEKCNLSKITIQANSRDVMKKTTENTSSGDLKPNPVKEHGTLKTIPVPTHSGQGPAVEKIKCYLKNPLQVVRNPMYLDSSSGSSLDQASINSQKLSIASDDSIVHFLTGINSEKGLKKATGMKQSAKGFKKLPQQITIQANSRDVMEKTTESTRSGDLKPNPVKEHGTLKTIPVPSHSDQSPAVEKIKCYLKNPLQVVRNPMYLDSSSGSSLDQASINSQKLSIESDDSIVHFLTGINSEKGLKKATGMKQSAKGFKKLPQQMKVRKKATQGIFEKKTAVSHKKPRKSEDMTPNQYADNPIAEEQTRILEIIRKQHRERAGTAPVKIEPSSAEHIEPEKKNGAKTEAGNTEEENLNRTTEFHYRLFPQEAKIGLSMSGVVVVETEEPISLPYIINNGYPYVPLSCIHLLFALCHCTLQTTVLRKSECMCRCIVMCSFEEAQILCWEGRHLKMPRITSGDRIVRIDRVAANLYHLRAEVKDAHPAQANKKGCYGLQLTV